MGVKAFVTKEITVRYLKPVNVLQPLKIIGTLEENHGRDLITRGEIWDESGELLTESTAVITRVNPDKIKTLK
jgi:acyl-CoA thioesterase FadM